MPTRLTLVALFAAGRTTALFYTGGTEQRGPQNVNGGHNLLGRVIVRTIAEKLSDAIAMPVLPYTPNNASATLPGTVGFTPELLTGVLERLNERSIATGFKTVLLMGDPAPTGPRGSAPNRNAPPRKANGITDIARKASKELDEKLFEMKVDDAVKQIQGVTGH